MTKKKVFFKHTWGVPKLEYNTSYLKGFELVEEEFLSLTLYLSSRPCFILKMPLEHLKINEGRFISELNIHDQKNVHLVDILTSIYGENGLFLNDFIGEDHIMHNVDIGRLCEYINSMSMMHVLLTFEYEELVCLDICKTFFKYDSKHEDIQFNVFETYQLDYSIGVVDVEKFYDKMNNKIN